MEEMEPRELQGAGGFCLSCKTQSTEHGPEPLLQVCSLSGG